MRVIFAKTKWEARELPLPEFLRRARSLGFTATEINIPELSASPKEMCSPNGDWSRIAV